MSDPLGPRVEKPWKQVHPTLDVDAPLILVDLPPPSVESITQGPDSKAQHSNSDGDGGSSQGSHHFSLRSTAPIPEPELSGPARASEKLGTNLASPARAALNADEIQQYHDSVDVFTLPPNSEQLHRPLFRTLAESDNQGGEPEASFSLPSTYVKPSPVSLAHRFEAKHLEDQPLDLATQVNAEMRPEYDLDESDAGLLGYIQTTWTIPGLTADVLETTMSLLDTAAALITLSQPLQFANTRAVDDTQQCVICRESECTNGNAIVFCDGCDIGVHQDCYGVPFIPEGQWLCRKCQLARGQNISCLACPWRSGAFKPTDSVGEWAHVVCGLWLPELVVPDDAFMEPILGTALIPRERRQLTCYICRQRGNGACIQCAHSRCAQPFHVTCAMAAGLYMPMNDGTVGALEHPELLLIWCDKHTPADAGTVVVDVAAARKQLELEKSEQRSDSLWAIDRYPYWRTESGAMAVPAASVDAVTHAIESRFNLTLPKPVLHLICRWWTVRRDRQGTMFSRPLKEALDTFTHTASNRRSRFAEASRTVQVLAHSLALARRIRTIVASTVNSDISSPDRIEPGRTRAPEPASHQQQSPRKKMKSSAPAEVSSQRVLRRRGSGPDLKAKSQQALKPLLQKKSHPKQEPQPQSPRKRLLRSHLHDNVSQASPDKRERRHPNRLR